MDSPSPQPHLSLNTTMRLIPLKFCIFFVSSQLRNTQLPTLPSWIKTTSSTPSHTGVSAPVPSYDTFPAHCLFLPSINHQVSHTHCSLSNVVLSLLPSFFYSMMSFFLLSKWTFWILSLLSGLTSGTTFSVTPSPAIPALVKAPSSTLSRCSLAIYTVSISTEFRNCPLNLHLATQTTVCPSNQGQL